MLDIVLRGVSFAYPKSSFALNDIDLVVDKSTHVAIVGKPGAGTSTLLKLIAGDLQPRSGEIRIGARDVTTLRRARRPILYATAEIDVPARWSVQHALVAAVRQRSLDRIDRQREYDLAVERWGLGALLSQSLRTLSSTERSLVHLARIELLRPAILVADRLLDSINPARMAPIADEFYRMLRVIGATVVSAPSSFAEQGQTDSVVVLSGGRIVQHATAAEVYNQPGDVDVAETTGETSLVPVTIRGIEVDSPIGSWTVSEPPFQGRGVAIVRPGDFTISAAGADSDLIISIEEAAFIDGRWMITAFVSGGITLHIALPSAERVHKGKLIALSYDPGRFRLIRKEIGPPRTGLPVDVLPPIRESR